MNKYTGFGCLYFFIYLVFRFSIYIYICILVQYMHAVHFEFDKDDVVEVMACCTFAESFLDLG